MNISVIGLGYVGLTAAACFAHLGNRVVGWDNDGDKVRLLKKGKQEIFEPGLGELIAQNRRAKRLFFAPDIASALWKAEVIFITGELDAHSLQKIARAIAGNPSGCRLIVVKSAWPLEAYSRIRENMRSLKGHKVRFDIASNPAFLRAGFAVNDFMHPARIVIGAESERARDILQRLYKPLKAPIFIAEPKSCELIQYACDAFLAVKMSFINAVSLLCDRVGADVAMVSGAMGLDKRIGSSALSASIGFGGLYLPKDIDALISISEKAGYDFKILKEARRISRQQKDILLDKIRDNLWIIKDKTIGILCVCLEGDSGGIPLSDHFDVIQTLRKKGARIRMYEPLAMRDAKELFGRVTFCKNAYEACKGADCLLILTGCDEFRLLNLRRVRKLLKRPLIIDASNIYTQATMREKGFTYIGMGTATKRRCICF